MSFILQARVKPSYRVLKTKNCTIWRTVGRYPTYAEAESEIPLSDRGSFRIVDTTSRKLFGVTLKNVLSERRISPKTLAEQSNVSERSIRDFICGARTPRLKAMSRIAAALDLPISYFIEEFK